MELQPFIHTVVCAYEYNRPNMNLQKHKGLAKERRRMKNVSTNSEKMVEINKKKIWSIPREMNRKV